jgi:hypothetical protein
MGNTAGKEASMPPGSVGSGSQSESMSTVAFTREYLISGLEGVRHGHGHNHVNVSGINRDKRKRDKDLEKFKIKSKEIMDLVVRYDENVDGGYLAPYDNYKYELDYNTEIVRSLIVKRKLAPFFTPLQDFDDSWNDDELIKYLKDNLQLHENIKPNDLNDEYEDPNEHKLHMSVNAIRRKESKIQIHKIKEKAAELQNFENSRFNKLFRLQESNKLIANENLNLPSNDLLLRLYRGSEECPICFLFYPKILNTTRCCAQLICSECFVQMKRSEPHFPHDENDNENLNENNEEIDPEKLISEPVKCPFCAVSNFGVTYTSPKDFRIGIEGNCKPGEFKFIDDIIHEENEEWKMKGNYGEGQDEEEDILTEIDLADPFSKKKSKIDQKKKHRRNSSLNKSKKDTESANDDSRLGKRRASIPHDAVNVVTIDLIRPDWEQNLLAARTKMARRSAAATALHATSLLSNNDSRTGYYSERRSRRGGRSYQQQQQQLEERLIEEAMRLSLLDEEERQLRERMKNSI